MRPRRALCSLGIVMLSLSAFSCAHAAAPLAPPFAGAPPPPRVVAASIASPPPPTPSPAPTAPVAPVASPPPLPAAPRGPTITIDAPYKLGEGRAPRGVAEADEAARWNAGGRGDPPAPEAPIDWHPDPRVIVDVLSSKGPLKQKDAERRARSKLWGAIVACYKIGAAADAKLRGKTLIRLEVAKRGAVKSARMTSTTLGDDVVAKCLVDAAKRIEMPPARSGSTVTTAIQVAPGDDPLPPPSGAIVAGEGALSNDAIVAAIEAKKPLFQACYEASATSAPALWGRLAMRLHVTASGEVDEAFEVESRFPDARAARCVLREARGLRFDAPSGGDVRIVVPLRFESGEEAR